jgi:hypothetical protein
MLIPQHVLDEDLVPTRVVLLCDEECHRVDLMLGLFGGHFGDRFGLVIVAVVVEHLFVAKEHVADDRVEDAGTDAKCQRVAGKVHVMMQGIDQLGLIMKVLLLVGVGQRLVELPRFRVLRLVVAAILVLVERDREELLLQGPLALAISTDRNFLADPVSAEQAPSGCVALGIRGNNLDDILQGVSRLKRRGLDVAHRGRLWTISRL